MTIKGRPINTLPVYDRELGATIYPWSDRLHACVGLAYVFDDDRSSYLIYMMPQLGSPIAFIHRTAMTVIDNGRGVSLESFPDPETDEILHTTKNGGLKVDPAP